MKKILNSVLFLIIPALLALITDRYTKSWVLNSIGIGESKPFIGNFLFLTHIHNEGGAFGLFARYRIFFIIMGFLVPLLIIIFFYKLHKKGIPWVIAAGLIFGGATGNLIDRIKFGHVIDFLDFRLNNNNVWPVFNIADIAITIGIAILFICMLKDNNEQDDSIAGKETSTEPGINSGKTEET